MNQVVPVQWLATSVNAVWQPRPGRGPHQALDAVAVGISDRHVNWILDADISDFLEAWLHCSFR